MTAQNYINCFLKCSHLCIINGYNNNIVYNNNSQLLTNALKTHLVMLNYAVTNNNNINCYQRNVMKNPGDLFQRAMEKCLVKNVGFNVVFIIK